MKPDILEIVTHHREELLEITGLVQESLERAGIGEGSVVLFVPHTTAAVTLNENSDPDVKRDVIDKLSREFPQRDSYLHREGNSDAHIKSSLIGASLQLIVSQGKLLLGTWQAVYFCEFDGPRKRKLYIKTKSD